MCVEDDDDADDDDNNNNQLYDIVELTSINKWLKKILSDGEWIIQHTQAATFETMYVFNFSLNTHCLLYSFTYFVEQSISS